MANSSVSTALGAPFDTETIPGGDNRQVICIGSKSVEADVAPVDAIGGVAMHLRPMISGGSSTDHTVAAASNNAKVIKGTPGQVYSVTVSNAAAGNYRVFVKLYDKATSPTVGTDTPKRTFGIQAGLDDHIEFPNGIAFTNGIGLAIVQGIADSDNTAVALNDAVVDVEYK